MTLTLTTQDNWLEYCALKFQSVNHFMYDLPRELLHVLIKLRNRKMRTDSVAIQSQYRSIDQEYKIFLLHFSHRKSTPED